MTSTIKITKSAVAASNTQTTVNSIYWFRKCLRLHDNPALIHALENSQIVYPIFILDPWFVKNAKVGPNRWRFLVQSLEDLNKSLIKRNSRLLLIRGPVIESLTNKINEWKINLICYESDTEPYAKQRDAQVASLAQKLNVKIVNKCSHTLYDPSVLFQKNGNKISGSYQSFLGLVQKIGQPALPVPEPIHKFANMNLNPDDYRIPSLAEMNVDESKCGPNLFPGGESEALKRFHDKFANESWICQFEKPKTSPNSLIPTTTVLSPYLKFGNLSIRLFYEKLMEVYRRRKNHSKPPESLEGQVFFREYFYFVGAYTENFDKMIGNSNCRQIKWDDDEKLLMTWKEGRTGFPFIDAIMTQLRQEGWIHHLGRHAVACFLTRGDLYQSWEKGMQVFEEYLLDADWSLNAANWQWLSASAFFHQYWKCYSPIEFGKKTDPDGLFIKKYLPVFKNFPSKYIYEPWTAPPVVQASAKCVIGVDYPKPIVDHKVDGKLCMDRMKQAFADIKEGKDVKLAATATSSKATVKSEDKMTKTVKLEKESKPVVFKSETATPKPTKSAPKKRPLKISPGAEENEQKKKNSKIEQFFVKKAS